MPDRYGTRGGAVHETALHRTVTPRRKRHSRAAHARKRSRLETDITEFGEHPLNPGVLIA
ncbi:hypothetical protein GCM10010251_31200 [Streptomyces aurantiogriseus]|uniref:Uncharacterized protein n=1 Tax=Streptomyces aurantiogriseus TaxID=66870 RepID=A0A918C8X1_9ACTN|nr:hypothetical protein GCM10010251_31200 [Streptomyces aurantiogriseus]